MYEKPNSSDLKLQYYVPECFSYYYHSMAIKNSYSLKQQLRISPFKSTNLMLLKGRHQKLRENFYPKPV